MDTNIKNKMDVNEVVDLDLEVTRTNIFQIAINALSNLEIPDFKDISQDTIFKAFCYIWDNEILINNFLQSIKNNGVTIQEIKEEDTEFAVDGPARYFILTKSDGVTMPIMFGPYSTPFHKCKLWKPERRM
jgi:hypothetical protein